MQEYDGKLTNRKHLEYILKKYRAKRVNGEFNYSNDYRYRLKKESTLKYYKDVIRTHCRIYHVPRYVRDDSIYLLNKVKNLKKISYTWKYDKILDFIILFSWENCDKNIELQDTTIWKKTGWTWDSYFIAKLNMIYVLNQLNNEKKKKIKELLYDEEDNGVYEIRGEYHESYD